MDAKYWKYFESTNQLFVGHMETAEADAKRLLLRLAPDAWERYGANGWGVDGKDSFFSTSAQGSVEHKTGAASRLAQYYTPDLAERVDEFYKRDYENPLLQLNQTKISF